MPVGMMRPLATANGRRCLVADCLSAASCDPGDLVDLDGRRVELP